MAHRIAYAPRIPVITPPPGWRKHMPTMVKLQVIINQRGLAPDGTALDALYVGVHFDHRPPLHEREYVEADDDTIPPANDHRFIVALPAPDHRAISGADVRRMKKTRRIQRAEEDFRKLVAQREPGQKRIVRSKIPTRERQ